MSIIELCEIIPAWPEVMTETQWLGARQHGIGGSEIGAIAGLSKYESPHSIWARKVHGINNFDGNEATDLGHLLEASVAQRYATEHNAAVVEWPVILRSKVHTFLSANVDRFIVEPCEQFPAGRVTVYKSVTPPRVIICLLECKTGALASPGSPKEWDNDSIPDSYACQGYWYLAATELPCIEYACLLGGHGMQYRTLHWDDKIIGDLLAIGEKFWTENVLGGVEPEVDGSNATEESLKNLYAVADPGSFIELDDSFLALWEEFEGLKAATKAAEKAQKDMRARLVKLIGSNETVLVNGHPVCTFKNSKDSEYFADKILEKEDPATYKRFLRTRAGHRTLRGT